MPTTGKPVMNADGSLQALEVTEGSITINGGRTDGTGAMPYPLLPVQRK